MLDYIAVTKLTLDNGYMNINQLKETFVNNSMLLSLLSQTVDYCSLLIAETLVLCHLLNRAEAERQRCARTCCKIVMSQTPFL